MSTWHAPPAAGPVSARVRPPGSKSITNRALVLAAVSSGPSVIENPLHARDTQLAVAALTTLGAAIPNFERTTWRVTPGSLTPGSAVDVEVGNSGTCMRFLPAVAALSSASVRFDGDARARERPVGALLGALRSLGVSVDGDAVPFTVHGQGSVRGGSVTLDASGSSQLVSGLLLAAPRFSAGIEVRHSGPPVPSAPHIAMTVRMLRAAGATVDVPDRPPRPQAQANSAPQPEAQADSARPDRWRVEPGPVDLGTVDVEPDLSNAGPFLAAALVTGGTVVIPGWRPDSLQASAQILDVFTEMGASCSVGSDGLTISGTGEVRGISADLRDVGELAQVLTAVAAVASSPSVFTGIGHIRTHETDRLAALAKEINALGGAVTEQPDGLSIRPRPLRAEHAFGTYDDHRMVMAAAVLGLVVPGLSVENAQTVGKTFPGFMEAWAAMLRS
ncbi:MAG: 3-phosphoshikimate 1-carboxyvinyltransferase [Streptosporangiaceae bacterium]|nr:3-phosphoshikimate 1-carboxyvinyltransferase [Streptosporangiaceae bacterium]